ncbi:MAG TPA: hypothetical protein VGJ22_09785, partial [Anaerolineales bacterium]
MKNKAARRKPGSDPRSFLYLAGCELIAAGLLTAAIAAGRHFVTTLAIAVAIAVVGAACVLLARTFGRNAELVRRVDAALSSVRLVPSGAILALSAFLFITSPSAQVTLMLAPILAAF